MQENSDSRVPGVSRSSWPNRVSPKRFSMGESTMWFWCWITYFTRSSTVVSCTLTECFSYITLFLKFNSRTDLLAFAIEPECLRRSTENRIGFKTKVALEVVGKVTYLTDLRTSRFLLQPKKTTVIFHLAWSSYQSMDIYRSDVQITKQYSKIKNILRMKPLPSQESFWLLRI